MIVRLGLPKSTGEFPGHAERLEAPVLISANSLWDNDRKQFREPGSAICDLDAALDSAGFVAMARYGGYRWSVEQYVELDVLDVYLPHHVKLHLFGVKGSALRHLEGHSRIHSTDSMAWDFRARRDARERGVRYTNDVRAAHMKRWYRKQVS